MPETYYWYSRLVDRWYILDEFLTVVGHASKDGLLQEHPKAIRIQCRDYPAMTTILREDHTTGG